MKTFFKKIINYFNTLLDKRKANIIGIDLGTVNTLICIKDKGIVLNESSTISYVQEDGLENGFLYGNKAKELMGKTPFRINVVNPIEDGVVSKNNLTEDMIRFFLSQTIGQNSLFLPTVIVGVPFSATDVEKKILQDIFERCSTKEVFLIYESIASAIGAGLKIDEPCGSVIIDIGGGTTEISVISLGGIIKNKTFKYGGRKIDRNIIEYMENKYNLLIGENTAENIKKQIGIAFIKNNEEAKTIVVQGRNIKTRIPQEITISQNDIVMATAEFTNYLIDNLKQILDITPPELMKDILADGVTVCGGGALIANLDYVIEQTTGLKATIAKEPEMCLIKGLQTIIKDYKQYDHILFKQI